MKIICCVCNKELGEKEGPDDEVSHSYCEPCKAEAMMEVHNYESYTARSGRDDEGLI